MEKEFNLSEKGKTITLWNWELRHAKATMLIKNKDIKKFIKIVEEILNRKPDDTTSRRRDLQNRLNKIKKRAGDKLTCQ